MQQLYQTQPDHWLVAVGTPHEADAPWMDHTATLLTYSPASAHLCIDSVSMTSYMIV